MRITSPVIKRDSAVKTVSISLTVYPVINSPKFPKTNMRERTVVKLIIIKRILLIITLQRNSIQQFIKL